MDLYAAYAGTAPAEVSFANLVSSEPTYFFGTQTQCEHETFGARTAARPVKIVDNVDIAPRVPVQPGDRIEVRGEMAPDPGRAPVVHWTHHDPQGRHVDGLFDSTAACMHSAAV